MVLVPIECTGMITFEFLQALPGKEKEEIEKWKDGSHPDLSKSLRSIREQKVREDRCIICMEGGDDGGSKVDLFSACCGQAYHASCYFQQLTWAQKKTSGTNNNIGKQVHSAC